MRIAAAILLTIGVFIPGVELEALPEQSAKPPEQTRLDYELTQSGQVSLAIYDSTGRQLRTLLTGVKQAAGKHSLTWDGLDRYGQAQPPGAYEWRMLETPGFKREFMVNLGTNITWAPLDYWPGNHCGPSSVMVDDQSNLYVGSRSTEGPPALIKMTMDGSQLLSSTGTWGMGDGLTDMVRFGEVLFLLFMGPPETCATLQIRRAEPDPNGNLTFYGHPVYRRFAEKRIPFADLLHQGDDRGQKKVSPMRMAGGKGVLAITYKNYDEVRLLWPKDDAIAKTESVKVSGPEGVAVAPDGRVYVASDHQIVCVEPGTPVAKPVVKDAELKSPGSLAYDRVNNDLIVVSGNHLRRYSAATGRLVAAYGRPEGRAYGVFNPLDFDAIVSLAADGKGGFFTVEANPRRVAHFQGREKHQLIQQWFGGLPWEWLALIDPENPTVAYMGIDSKHLGRGEIDFGKKTWTLTHLYDLPERFSWGANGEDEKIHAEEPGVKSDMVPGATKSDMFPGLGGYGWRVRHAAGQTLLVNCARGVSVVRVDEKENRLVPVATLGCLHPTWGRRYPPDWWVAALKNMGIDASSREGIGTDNPKAFGVAGGYKHFCYSWSDADRNGRIDAKEIALGSVGSLFTESFVFVDEAWNVYWPGGPDAAWTVIPNEGKEKDLPVWNWEHRRPGKGAFGKREQEIAALSPLCGLAGSDGAVYWTTKGSWPNGDVAPLQWPNNASTVSRFVKWNSQGLEEFSVGFHTPMKDGVPGGFADIRAIVGQARGNIVVRDACAPATVWTPDGLYAGSFCHFAEEKKPRDAARERRQLDKSGQPSPPWTDDAMEGLVLETPRGEVIWGANDCQNTVYYRIHGWDRWERQKGKLTLAAPAPSASWQGKGLKAEIFANPNLSGDPALRRVDPDIWFGPMWGDHREVPARKGFFKKDEAPAGLSRNGFSGRWSGFVEPPVNEDFNFVLFCYGNGGPRYNPPGFKGSIGSRVKLWVDGKLVVDSWDGVQQQKFEGWYRTENYASGSIPLEAGKRVPIKLEYSAAGEDLAHLHLYWESPSWELRHIPSGLLYPE